MSRPPTLAHYVDPQIKKGLAWWKNKIGPISTREIPFVRSFRRGYDLALSDAWTLLAWSEWFQHSSSSSETLTILHVDDHRDFMSPRLCKGPTCLVDMLTGTSFDLNKPLSVRAAIESGAVGMGSFIAPFLLSFARIDIRQLTVRNRTHTGGERSLDLRFENDDLLDTASKRPAIAVSESIRNKQNAKPSRYRATNDHTEWLRDLSDGPILLHIDMDYFNNRYDCDSDRLLGTHWYDPSVDQVLVGIDTLFSQLEQSGITRRIEHCSIALSPGFYPGDLWELGIERIDERIGKLVEEKSWGFQKNGLNTSELVRTDALGAAAQTSEDVVLVPGKGSATRGTGPGGRYWHIFAQKRRIGCVFINVVGAGKTKRPSLQIFLSAHARGQGYGRVAYRLACEQSGFPEIRIEMRKSNIASRRAAEAAGFRIDSAAKGPQLAMIWKTGDN